MDATPPLSEDDRTTLLGLVLRYGIIRRENVFDRKEKERIDARVKARATRMQQLRSAFEAFGFQNDGEGYFNKIRKAVGEQAYVAMLAKIDEVIPDPEGRVAPTIGPVQPASEPEPVSNIPDLSVRELVLACLKAAGDAGVKASRIRGEIEAQRGSKLHEKTIGMTLYRLSQAEPPQARREGTTWFFVPSVAEKKNPGGETPGPSNGSK